jgi:hypothetical protein
MSLYKKINTNSYIISLGNTGARFSDPRSRYYKVLEVLEIFKKQYQEWSIAHQLLFAEVLIKQGIFDIKKDNVVSADKDVRLKTSFLAQIGFTNNNRDITPVGRELIACTQQLSINDFELATDSFLYLKQFLKYQQEGFELKPLLSLIYCCIAFDNALPIDFLTYVWAGARTEEELLAYISYYKLHNSYKEAVYQSVRASATTLIASQNIDVFFSEYTFANTQATKELLYELLPHGKGNTFKKKAVQLFYDLYLYWQNKDCWQQEEKITYIETHLKARYKDISSKKPQYYLEALFATDTLTKKSDWQAIIQFFEHTTLMRANDEKAFLEAYHVLYMYIKKLSICEEYRDLNIRHLKLLDIFVFGNDIIQLDIIFWYLFREVKEDLLKQTAVGDDTYRVFLETSQSTLGDIYPFLAVKVATIVSHIAVDYPEIQEIGLKNFTNKKKEERLEQLIQKVFTKEHIVKLLEQLYPRRDDEVRRYIKELYQEYEATIPALFEYLLAISFYWLSEQQISISDILTPNLDANLLPKTHTAGGQADIILRHKNKDYLIEATLSDNDNQRKMEAEPVPRHLAKHILEVNANSIALFVAGQLDPNNLVVLRNYKFSTWYANVNNKVEGMNILPLTIANMIFLLKRTISFEEIDNQFDILLNSPTKDGYQWYINEVNPTFEYEN